MSVACGFAMCNDRAVSASAAAAKTERRRGGDRGTREELQQTRQHARVSKLWTCATVFSTATLRTSTQVCVFSQSKLSGTQASCMEHEDAVPLSRIEHTTDRPE